jgi:hypothetical protein
MGGHVANCELCAACEEVASLKAAPGFVGCLGRCLGLRGTKWHDFVVQEEAYEGLEVEFAINPACTNASLI